MGLSYSDFLKMDIRQYNNYIDGYIDRRETNINDNQSLIKTQASQIAMAVWGDKGFRRPLKPIRLRGETRAEMIARTLNGLGVTKKGLYRFLERKGMIK